MKIILVGALRYSNFGDILFAKLFYNKIKDTQKSATILLYETIFNPVSEFCRKELGYHNHFKLSDLIDADVLVYISGGYFSNSFENTLTKILWHIRYALPGLFFSKKKKRIYVIGVGGGNFSWDISGKAIRNILDNAVFISVRNIETAIKLKRLGTQAKIHIYSDTAQVIAKQKTFYCHTNIIDKKHIFLHIIPDDHYYELLFNRIFPAIKTFVSIQNNYDIILGYDATVKEKYNKYLYKSVKYFGEDKSTIYTFDSVEGFMHNLGTCDLVVTPKLHVGIVSASFGKSVLSFPINYDKTIRYYNSIGYPERCVNIYNVDSNHVLNMLNRFYNENILLNSKVIESSEQNLIACEMI